LATAYATTYGLPTTIARCGNIFGPGDLNWSRFVPGTIRSLLRNERPVLRSTGANIRDYIYVADVVDAYLVLAEAIDRPDVRGQAFNFSPETRITVLEITRAITHLMESRLEPVVLGTATHTKSLTRRSIPARPENCSGGAHGGRSKPVYAKRFRGTARFLPVTA